MRKFFIHYIKPIIVLIITSLPYNRKLSLLLDKLDNYHDKKGS